MGCLDRGGIVHAGRVEPVLHPHRSVPLREVRDRAVAQVLDHHARVIEKSPGAGFNMVARERQTIQRHFGIKPGGQAAKLGRAIPVQSSHWLHIGRAGWNAPALCLIERHVAIDVPPSAIRLWCAKVRCGGKADGPPPPMIRSTAQARAGRGSLLPNRAHAATG
jgi:hypothetical protein